MTKKELMEVLDGCPDDTVIAIVNYRGWISRGLSLYGENPFAMVKDTDGCKTPHLFLFEDNRSVVMYGITPQEEIDDMMYWEKEKERRAEKEAKRKARKSWFMNLLKSKKNG